MKINEMNLNNLRNEEHLNLSNGLKELVTDATPAALGIGKQWPVWLTLHENEKEAVEFIRKSAHTKALELADLKRDDVIVGFRSLVRANTLHFNPAKKAAGLRLMVVFDQYNGIEKRAYNEETTSIESLLADLNGSYTDDLNLLGLSDYMTELQSCNQAFNTLQAERYTETAVKSPLRMKEVRKEIDEVYAEICGIINAHMLLEGGDVLSGFINELNSRIDGFKTLIAQRKGRGGSDDDIPEAPQA
jgi:hypothetical protein